MVDLPAGATPPGGEPSVRDDDPGEGGGDDGQEEEGCEGEEEFDHGARVLLGAGVVHK